MPSNELFENERLNDTITWKKYRNLGYTKNDFIYFNNDLTKHLIYIKAHEVLYYETYFSLPINDELLQYVPLRKTKKYKVNFILKSDTTNIKKYLTWSQLKNIEANNYQLFQDTIVS